MVEEHVRPPRRAWLVIAAAPVAFVASVVLRSQTSGVTWYEWGLLILAVGLMTCGWGLLAPTIIHSLRPSSYQHKSTTGERLVLAVLAIVLASSFVTLSTGPGWLTAVLLATGLLGSVLLVRQQKRRIHGSPSVGDG